MDHQRDSAKIIPFRLPLSVAEHRAPSVITCNGLNRRPAIAMTRTRPPRRRTDANTGPTRANLAAFAFTAILVVITVSILRGLMIMPDHAGVTISGCAWHDVCDR
jgi:hypothetical protein